MFAPNYSKRAINPEGMLLVALCCESETFYEQNSKKYYCLNCGGHAQKVEMRHVCRRTHVQKQKGIYSPLPPIQ